MNDPFAMRRGFTLIELLVVIAIISLLASVVLASLNSARAKARDARRLADMDEVTKALHLYYDANAIYPIQTTPPVTGWVGGSYRGWEVSYKGDFMEYLRPYLASTPVDPVNVARENAAGDFDDFFPPRPQDGNLFYMYYGNYGSGATYGCPWVRSFGVVGFRALETGDPSRLPQARCGPMPCPGGGQNLGTPSACRNWQTEFDYSVFMIN